MSPSAGPISLVFLWLAFMAVGNTALANDPPDIGAFLEADPTVEEVAIEDLTAEEQGSPQKPLAIPNNEVLLEDLPRPVEIQKASNRHVSPSVSRNFLDIRPRSIDGSYQLIATGDLPVDTSDLPKAESIGTLMATYRADLHLSDFIRGASFCHRPLHFEDPYLERYGHAVGCGSRWPLAHSSAHMIWKTGLFPASVAIDPPWRRRRSGFHEPYWSRVLKR
ncbi:MAG: hypothetical protein AAFU85_19435 [Planctomycetota bacterium]